MSQKGNVNDLLINFDNLAIDDSTNAPTTDNHASYTNNQHSESHAKSASMTFMCSATPIYKLLGSGSIDVNDNNPFDQMDKKANLADDPFEIVEYAACANTSNPKSDRVVEMGTLISLDSPILVRDDTPIAHSEDSCFNEKCDTLISVQNTSHKMATTLKETPTKVNSPTGKSRGKPRTDSLSLLKYSFSNSRSEVNTDNNTSPTLNDSINDDQMIHRMKLSTLAMRRNSNDESFDDIWSTKPNLIDSQTDIDIESDIDSDLATLNIPMLNESKTQTKSPEHIDAHNVSVDEAKEPKNVHRNDLLEKLASIKQNNLSSPRRSNVTAPVHNESVDEVKLIETRDSDDEPFTPKSQYSTIRPEQLMSANNPNSLIDNLRQLVNQCDDQLKQSEAKHLLDNLSSLLTKDKAPGLGPRSNTFIEPKPIQRQGTFSIEKDEQDEKSDEDKRPVEEESNNVTTDELVTIDKEEKVIASNESSIKEPRPSTSPDYSDIVKQIQAVLSAQQNANLLQSNAQQQNTQARNPIIVVIPQSNDVCDILQTNEARNMPSRARSRSLNLKEKPLAALKAAQAKNEIQQRQAALPITPIKRPFLTRRSSFGAIQRPVVGATPQSTHLEKVTESKLNVKTTTTTANAATLRRRSLQTLITDTKEPVVAQKKETTTLNRRRSFQCPSTSTSSGIRSPSPKPNMSNASSLTRRRSFNNQPVPKDTPQKLKSSYGILKKPAAAPSNLKIRVTQTLGSRAAGTSTRAAPMKAVVPMSCVAPSLLPAKDIVSPIENKRDKSLITSTPRNFSIPKPSDSLKKSEFVGGR